MRKESCCLHRRRTILSIVVDRRTKGLGNIHLDVPCHPFRLLRVPAYNSSSHDADPKCGRLAVSSFLESLVHVFVFRKQTPEAYIDTDASQQRQRRSRSNHETTVYVARKGVVFQDVDSSNDKEPDFESGKTQERPLANF